MSTFSDGSYYPRRLKGHKLSMEWSGEYGEDSSSTGYCICGWEESASNQKEVRFEYRYHLQEEERKKNLKKSLKKKGGEA